MADEIRTILNALDGAYYLVGESGQERIPDIPDATTGVSVNTAPDFVLITTFGSWADVKVDVLVLPMPFRQSGPLGWDVVAVGEVDVSGPLYVTDMEFDPQAEAGLSMSAGRHLVQVHARSIEYVRERPFLHVDGPATEQHRVYVSPVPDLPRSDRPDLPRVGRPLMPMTGRVWIR